VLRGEARKKVIEGGLAGRDEGVGCRKLMSLDGE